MSDRTRSMRKDARLIFKAGIKAVQADATIRRNMRLDGEILKIGDAAYDLSSIEHIYVIGAGKACAPMAGQVERLLGKRITGGVISVKYDHGVPLETIRVMEAGHPVPDENGVNAAEAIMKVVQKAGRNDLVICLLTGGGSALIPLPSKGITLEDKQAVTRSLLACGADIHEMNAIRKHLSRIKGGQLAKAVSPARMVTLVQSDVVGDDLDVIASGPTVPDTSSFKQCMEILERYHLFTKVPPGVRQHFENGINGLVPDTPEKDEPFFRQMTTRIISSNQDALEACLKQAQKMGYHAFVLTSQIQGDNHTAAGIHAGIARQILTRGQPLDVPACLLSGGETTLVLKGNGKGGRNQEAALKAALDIAGCYKTVMLFAGTDGTDGPTDAAGAIVDHETVERSAELGLNPVQYLAQNDAYHFFEALGDLLVTGPTGANVMDLNIVLVDKPLDLNK